MPTAGRPRSCRSDPPSVVLALVLAEEARGLMLLSRFADVRGALPRGLAVARAVGARAEEGHAALHARLLPSAARATTTRASSCVRQALAIAEEVGSADDLTAPTST